MDYYYITRSIAIFQKKKNYNKNNNNNKIYVIILHCNKESRTTLNYYSMFVEYKLKMTDVKISDFEEAQ